MDTNDTNGSVTRLIGDLAGADADEAARLLWERYFERLVRLARNRLGTGPRGVADEEDAALSAFDSFCRGVAEGRFPGLGDRDDLWRLLATITARKAVDHAQREGRRKRGGGKVLGEGDLAGRGSEADPGGFERVAGSSPTPSFAVMMGEEVRRLFANLPDESLRQVASLKLEGHTNQEIAAELGCALRSVERKLMRIRVIWAEEGPS